VTYTHQVVQVDLTQVADQVRVSPSFVLFFVQSHLYRLELHDGLQLLTALLSLSPACPGQQKGQKRHELEVEVVNVPQLLEEAAANEQGQENTYGSLVGVLLGSVRMLVRNAS
jgi:hypothetical protein